MISKFPKNPKIMNGGGGGGDLFSGSSSSFSGGEKSVVAVAVWIPVVPKYFLNSFQLITIYQIVNHRPLIL